MALKLASCPLPWECTVGRLKFVDACKCTSSPIESTATLVCAENSEKRTRLRRVRVTTSFATWTGVRSRRAGLPLADGVVSCPGVDLLAFFPITPRGPVGRWMRPSRVQGYPFERPMCAERNCWTRPPTPRQDVVESRTPKQHTQGADAIQSPPLQETPDPPSIEPNDPTPVFESHHASSASASRCRRKRSWRIPAKSCSSRAADRQSRPSSASRPCDGTRLRLPDGTIEHACRESLRARSSCTAARLA